MEVELNGAVLPDGSLIGAFRDITERRRAEAALRSSEELFHTMADWANDWEYWVSPEGNFNYMTPSVVQVTGYQEQDFENDKALLNTFVFPDDRPLWVYGCYMVMLWTLGQICLLLSSSASFEKMARFDGCPIVVVQCMTKTVLIWGVVSQYATLQSKDVPNPNSKDTDTTRC